MSEVRQFKLPDVGEGLTEADIVKWHVQPGDTVTVNQTIVEIETAKAMVELPCPFDGVVAGLLVPEGQTVDVGTPIISIDTSGAAVAAGATPDTGGAGRAGAAAGARTEVSKAGEGAPDDAAAGRPAPGESAPPAAGRSGMTAALAENLVPPPPAEGPAEPGVHGSPAPKQERQPVLVGYGVKLGAAKRRPRKGVPSGGANAAAAAGTGPAVAAHPARPTPPAASAVFPAAPAPEPAEERQEAYQTPRNVAVLAKPPVRKLARELGVNLAAISGTGPSGSITRSDVQAAAATGEAAVGAREGAAAAPAWPATAGPLEERVAIRGVRKHTAAAVTASAFTAPHVTEFLQVDMTATVEATRSIRALAEFAEMRVSPLLLVAKALLVATARHPMINSSWDDAAQEIVVKRYVNLGIAAATERGLIVPNIKNAHALPLPVLARALTDLAQTARAGRTSPADLQGGTITITNVGVFGVDTGTPILTPGEAAILAFGQVRAMPWVHAGELAVRQVCTLSLSFDHRIVDGDLGSAVLGEVGAMLEDPARMIAWA